MKKTISILPLVEKWECFSAENPQKDMYEFAQWLLTSRKEAEANSGQPVEEGNIENAVRAAVLVTRLQKYLGTYVKPYIKEMGFTKPHEYDFLYQVSKMNKPNKNDLSKENMVELSTGRDVIRRLVSKGLIRETEDPNDKRAANLTLTSKGKKTLNKSFGLISETFMDFLGDLSEKEQTQLITLLTKVNKYQALKNKKEILSYL